MSPNCNLNVMYMYVEWRPSFSLSLSLSLSFLVYSLTHYSSSLHSQCFSYDCHKRSNLLALDTDTLLYAAGNYLVFISISTGRHVYLRSIGGRSIGAITVSISL